MITSNKHNMDFLSVPNLFPWLIFNVNILRTIRIWIVTDQFCWCRLHFNLRGKLYKRKRTWRWTIIWGIGYYFKYFRGWGKGGAAIIPGRQLIEGRLLFWGNTLHVFLPDGHLCSGKRTNYSVGHLFYCERCVSWVQMF